MGDPDLVRAQHRALRQLVPLLYLTIIPNTLAVAYSFYGIGPDLYTVWMPGTLLCGAAVRLHQWRNLSEATTHAQAVSLMRSSLALMALLSVMMVIWACALYQYGTDLMRSQLMMYMGLTTTVSIFTLVYLRLAPIIMTALVVPTIVTLFVLNGNSVLIAMAANYIVVMLVSLRMLSLHNDTFVDMVTTRSQLLSQRDMMKALSDENFRLANHDALTGLPNRRFFFSQLATVLAEAKAAEQRFAIALIDLDGFKPVNDVHGHGAGDLVLSETAHRLQQAAGPDVTVARLGGDEFALLITSDIGDNALHKLGDAISHAMTEPFSLPGNSKARLSCSCGIAVFPDASATEEGLFERADYALYRSKTLRQGVAEIFSSVHEHDIRLRSRIEQVLLDADLDRELDLHFQPIVDGLSRNIVAVEALARWTSPDLGDVPPDIFIKVAEKTHIISRVTEVLLAKALAQMAHWPKTVALSFNLSALDVASPETILRLTSTIAKSGIPPYRITFEITETALMRDIEAARASLTALRSLGVSISLDDFGTGFSSLSYVHRLPIDKIKIDRSFIKDLEDDRAARDIVKTIIDMCNNLQMGCVAEGVETAGQYAVLQRLGCTSMQGYYFARAIRSNEIAAYLNREAGDNAYMLMA